MQSPLQHTSEEIPADQHKRRRVCPVEHHIGDAQRPGCEEGIVTAQDISDIAVSALTVRVTAGENGIIRADHEDHYGGCQMTDVLPRGPAFGRKEVPGITIQPQPITQPKERPQRLNAEGCLFSFFEVVSEIGR